MRRRLGRLDTYSLTILATSLRKAINNRNTNLMVETRTSPYIRVRNEKIDCHRFSGMATQCVELFGTDIERIDIEAPSLSFLQEKIKR